MRAAEGKQADLVFQVAVFRAEKKAARNTRKPEDPEGNSSRGIGVAAKTFPALRPEGNHPRKSARIEKIERISKKRRDGKVKTRVGVGGGYHGRRILSNTVKLEVKEEGRRSK